MMMYRYQRMGLTHDPESVPEIDSKIVPEIDSEIDLDDIKNAPRIVLPNDLENVPGIVLWNNLNCGRIKLQ